MPPLAAPRRCEAATAANQKRLTEANEGNEVSAFTPNSAFVLFVTFCETPSPIAFEHVFEGSVKVCIERIRPVRLCRQITPVLVHPEPACCILSYVSDRDASALMQPGVRGSDAFR